MKKLFAILLSISILLSPSTTAFAAEITSDSTQNTTTTVTYGADAGYLVAIPESVALDTNTKAGSASISASNVVIASGETLNVTINSNSYSDGFWVLTDVNNNTNKLNYAITQGETVLSNGDTVLSVAAGEHYNSTAYATLDFEIADEATRAGNYSDTLTFTVNVAEDIATEDVAPGATLSDGTFLTWEALKLEENGTKYGYKASAISDTSIGSYALHDCEFLTSIRIPDGVTSIGRDAFEGCTSLTSVTIPDSVTTINDGAFSGCTSLTSVDLTMNSSGSTNIPQFEVIFYGCTNLAHVNITDTDGELRSVDGIVYMSNTLIYCPPGRTSVTIPDGITSINALQYNGFKGCSKLTSVTIPNSMKSINSSAFSGCTSLTSIGPVGSGASVEIPNSVTSIDAVAFSGCTSLTSVTLPDNLTSIDGGAFSGCTSLKEINIDSNNPKYCSVDGVLYNKTMTKLVICPAGKIATSFTIPNSVTSIGYAAFEGCTSLTSIGPVGSGASVEIPNSVTSIDQSAFYRCASLTSVDLPDSLTSIGGGAFFFCTSLANINYAGSTSDWGNITLGFFWNNGVPATYVQCSDGTVSL